jgi:hypothetical protein
MTVRQPARTGHGGNAGTDEGVTMGSQVNKRPTLTGFGASVLACEDYIDGLPMRLACVENRESERHFLRQRTQWMRQWSGEEAEQLIAHLAHIAPEEFGEQLAQQPDVVPFIFFGGTCNSGVRYRSWGSRRLADVLKPGRLVAIVWFAAHICAGGWGSLSLWAWQDGGPSVPMVTWRDGESTPAPPGGTYSPPFQSLRFSEL